MGPPLVSRQIPSQQTECLRTDTSIKVSSCAVTQTQLLRAVTRVSVRLSCFGQSKEFQSDTVASGSHKSFSQTQLLRPVKRVSVRHSCCGQSQELQSDTVASIRQKNFSQYTITVSRVFTDATLTGDQLLRTSVSATLCAFIY